MGKYTLFIKNQWFLRGLLVFIIFLFIVFSIRSNYTNSSPKLAANEPLEKEQNDLYTLLVAEMAAQRQMKDLALENYLKVAILSEDPSVAQQATLLAINLEVPDKALIGAELWANKAPQDLQAQLIAMTLVISQSKERAIPYLTRAIELQPIEADQYIIEIQARLSEGSAQNLKKALHQIALERPLDPYAHLVAAQSAAEEKDVKNATRWVDSALRQKSDLTRAIVLKSRLIRYEKNSDTPALSFLEQQLEQFPENKELRFFYASALIDNEKNKEAKAALSKLTDDKIFGGPALLFLSELSLKENRWEEAKQLLTKALTMPPSKDAALYLLGQIDEQQGHLQTAIDRYSMVNPGPHHISAILRAVTLLKQTHAYKEAIYLLHNSTPSTIDEQKHLLLTEIDLLNASKLTEDAMQLANEILPKLPDDPEVLYTHAITAIKLKQWDIAESDLKKILKQNPNNASALNALGYTLSFNTERLSEAIQYIKQALSIAPNDPNFMDSMGLAYYRKGDLTQAELYLEKANNLSQDSKISAHFGEVLWVSNQKNKAMVIWKKALQKNADHEELLETLKRFNVELKN